MHRTIGLVAVLLFSGLLLAAVPLSSLPSTAAPPIPDPPPMPKKSAFEVVIKQPTGQNGYEELVYAGDLLCSCPSWQRFAAITDPPLSRTREVLLDRKVVQALRLVRQGLQKPVSSPRKQLTFESTMREWPGIRALGRLLAAQEEVFFADGRIAEALGNARLGMRLGQVVQMDSRLAMSTGERIGMDCTRPLGEHLEQLSTRDVETLYQLCLEWLRQPSPELRVLDAERRAALGTLEELRGRRVSKASPDPQPDPDEDEEFRRSWQVAIEVRQVLASGPAVRDQFFAETARQIDGYYQQLQAEFRRPFWERHYPDFPQEGPLPVRFAATMVSSPSGLGEIHTRGLARMRLLACHAAVLRYRWEHRKAPATLAELNLGELAIDPFTGKVLEYRAMGRRYHLVSAGPEAPDHPNAVGGRLPFSVTPDD
jgi:hypothetical protein